MSRLSFFQLSLLREMEPDIWYDCYYNQGTGGAVLPEWFYRNQTQAMATLRPMIYAKALEVRRVGLNPDDTGMKFPQVRKPINSKGDQK